MTKHTTRTQLQHESQKHRTWTHVKKKQETSQSLHKVKVLSNCKRFKEWLYHRPRWYGSSSPQLGPVFILTRKGTDSCTAFSMQPLISVHACWRTSDLTSNNSSSCTCKHDISDMHACSYHQIQLITLVLQFDAGTLVFVSCNANVASKP